MTSDRSRPTEGDAGSVLIIVLVSLVLMAVVTGISVSTLLATAQVADSSIGRARMDLETHNVLEMVMRELLAVDAASVSPEPFPDGSAELHYRRLTAIAAGAPIWSDERSLLLRDAANDPPDGVDNDLDGLVDEMELVSARRVGEPEEWTNVLCDRIPRLAAGELANGVDDNGNGLIDEAGFALLLVRDVLTVRLSLSGRDAAGRDLTKSVESAVRLRNRTL